MVVRPWSVRLSRVFGTTDKPLLDLDQSAVLQLRQVGGEVALGQAGQALQEEEVGALTPGKSRQDGEASRLMDQFIQAS
jgi:hypothetical protein